MRNSIIFFIYEHFEQEWSWSLEKTEKEKNPFEGKTAQQLYNIEKKRLIEYIKSPTYKKRLIKETTTQVNLPLIQENIQWYNIIFDYPNKKFIFWEKGITYKELTTFKFISWARNIDYYQVYTLIRDWFNVSIKSKSDHDKLLDTTTTFFKKIQEHTNSNSFITSDTWSEESVNNIIKTRVNKINSIIPKYDDNKGLNQSSYDYHSWALLIWTKINDFKSYLAPLHELVHWSTSSLVWISELTKENLFFSYKWSIEKTDEFQYYSNPTEIHARLTCVKYLAHVFWYFNAFQDDLTPNILQKLKNNDICKADNNLSSLLENIYPWQEDVLIEMANLVADIEDNHTTNQDVW